jgi:trans-aconitate methyltransferase
MKDRNIKLDTVSYVCATRASSKCQSWEQTVQLLNEAKSICGIDLLHVAHTTMLELKFDVRVGNTNFRVAIQRLSILFDWIVSSGLVPTSRTMVIYIVLIS